MYHVIVKGINKERIFNQRREKSYFIKIILKHLKVYKVEIYSSVSYTHLTLPTILRV